jgi:hypothetical protein
MALLRLVKDGGTWRPDRQSGHTTGPCSTRCHHSVRMGAMSAQPEITQRDLRNRSKEIMDALESGRSFTVTRDGHEIGELIP